MIPILFVALFAVAEVTSACNSAPYYATTIARSFEYLRQSNKDYCDLNIIPSPFHRSGYYLEITWKTFEIEGSMPNCIDYVEVFLTRNKKSIGKYCSGYSASSSIFNMYSKDGYATIRFKSDSSTSKGGFKFTYKLRSIQTDYVGRYGSSKCYYTEESSSSGIMYGYGWPKGYADGKCYHKFSLFPGKEIRIVVMDLDLQNVKSSCDDKNDNFHIRASDSPAFSASVVDDTKALTKRYCGYLSPRYFTAKYSYVYLIINKPTGSYPHYSNAGFMIGYIIYDSVELSSNPSTSSSNLSKVGSGIGVLLIMAIFIAVVVYIKKRQKAQVTAVIHSEPQTAAIVSTTQQSVASKPYPICQFNSDEIFIVQTSSNLPPPAYEEVA